MKWCKNVFSIENEDSEGLEDLAVGIGKAKKAKMEEEDPAVETKITDGDLDDSEEVSKDDEEDESEEEDTSLADTTATTEESDDSEEEMEPEVKEDKVKPVSDWESVKVKNFFNKFVALQSNWKWIFYFSTSYHLSCQ